MNDELLALETDYLISRFGAATATGLSELADKQAVRGWLKGFDHEVLRVGRVFANPDGSAAGRVWGAAIFRAMANGSPISPKNGGRRGLSPIAHVQCRPGQVADTNPPHPAEPCAPDHLRRFHAGTPEDGPPAEPFRASRQALRQGHTASLRRTRAADGREI